MSYEKIIASSAGGSTWGALMTWVDEQIAGELMVCCDAHSSIENIRAAQHRKALLEEIKELPITMKQRIKDREDDQ